MPSGENNTSWFKAYFKEGNLRNPQGWLRTVITFIAVGLAIFEIWLAAWGTIDLYQYATIFYPVMLAVAFLFYSSTKRVRGNTPTWLDMIFALIALGIEVYFLLHIEQYLKRIPLLNPLTPMELVIGVALVILTLEAIRRTLGIALPIIVLVFVIYTCFGHLIPGAYSHRLITVNHFLDDMVYTINGIFGTPIGVAATYVFMFVLFGAFFTHAGGGDFFFKLAAAISGRSSGGPAKVAVMSAGMFGMISGSPTSDVLTTGSVNIPIMKRMGYKPVFAGGVESAAATGGAILPPIMGSAAFLMAEYAGIHYREIVIAALVPALLYYLGILLQVHFRSRKNNIGRMSKDEIPPLWRVLKEGWIYIFPLVFLVVGILSGRSAPYVALLTSAVIIICSWFVPGKRIGIRSIINIFYETIERMIPVTMACAAAGMLISSVMLTGLAPKFGSLIFEFTFGSLFLTLLATAIMCIIFGMGMPVASAYILTAVLAAPVLINMGIPAMNAHLFIVYYSSLSAITPPVAVAAFAASSIARDDPIKIALNACKLAFVAFILPFFFVYSPGLLLEGDWLTIVRAIPLATLGVFLIAVAAEGWFRRNLNFLERALLLIAGFLLITPETITDFIGFVIAVAILTPKFIKSSRLTEQNQST